MTAKELYELSAKYLNGTATEEEKRLLHQWYMHGADDKQEIEINSIYANEAAMEAALYEKIRQSILDSVHSGLIAQQGSSNIVKQGQALSYQPTGNATAITYNTITTLKGRQYPNLVLADGSKIWLDAGSSIRFPVSFSGSERK